MSASLRLVLFDCDGTLVDSAAFIQQCMHKTFIEFGLSPPHQAETRAIIGLSLDQAIATLCKRPVDAEIEAMVVAYRQAFWALRQGTRPLEPLYDGVSALLKTLYQMPNILLGVVTGKSRRGLDAICAQNRMENFITIRTADDCPSKPHPAMVEECCQEVGVSANQCYVVGDSIYDMQMAKAASANAVGVSWGYHSSLALKEVGADFIINTPRDLCVILNNSLR